MNNDTPSKLPSAPLVKPDITDGAAILPPTGLLSEAERRRLDELSTTGQTPSEPSEPVEIQSFSDGSFFKFTPRPGSASQQILVDAMGQQIAIVKNEELADFIANAVNLFALAQLKHEAEGTQMQIVQRPIIFPGNGK